MSKGLDFFSLFELLVIAGLLANVVAGTSPRAALHRRRESHAYAERVHRQVRPGRARRTAAGFPVRDQVAGVYLVAQCGRQYSPAAHLERSVSTELESGQTATARRIFTLPVGARDAGFLVQRVSGPPLRCLLVGGPYWFSVPAQPPVILE
jgi:hypothetical protein